MLYTANDILEGILHGVLALATTAEGEDDAPLPLVVKSAMGRLAGFADRAEWLARSIVTKGQWITIGAKADEDGKSKGGSHVYIENGRITRGHPSLQGKKISALKEEAVDERSGKKQAADAKGYGRAVWGKKARKEGIKPAALHQLAGEVMAHDKAHVKEWNGHLADARIMAKNNGVNITNLSNAFKDGDHDQIKFFDHVASVIGPEMFRHGRPDQEVTEDFAEQLFNALRDGNRTPMSADDAYAHAFDHLRDVKEKDAKDAKEEETEFNFGASAKAVPFDESKVHRGQPDNAGQFGPGGSANGQPDAPKGPPVLEPLVDQAAVDAAAEKVASTTWDQLKQLGHKARHVEHAVKEWVALHIEAHVARYPHGLQVAVKATWLAIRFGTHTAFVTYTAGQVAAEYVAKKRGATPEQASALRAALSATDIALAKPVILGLSAMGLGAVALPASFLPIGSMTYLAYSGSHVAVQRLGKAKAAIEGLIAKRTTKAMDTTGADLADGVLSIIMASDDPDLALALYLAALDETQDANEAVRLLHEAMAGRDNREVE